MEIQEHLAKEFKIIMLKKLNKLQEYMDTQLKKIRKIIHEQNRGLIKKTTEFNSIFKGSYTMNKVRFIPLVQKMLFHKLINKHGITL
jgi:hypothetical protein